MPLNQWMSVDRRREARRPVSGGSLCVQIHDAVGVRTAELIVRNVSAEGIGLSFHHPLAPGAQFVLPGANGLGLVYQLVYRRQVADRFHLGAKLLCTGSPASATTRSILELAADVRRTLLGEPDCAEAEVPHVRTIAGPAAPPDAGG